jgi:hypothetical protein
MNFLSYLSGDDRTSILHGVPIDYLDEIRLRFAICGFRIKVRFRGPRKHRRTMDRRNAQSYCLMADAVTFAVYRR